MEYASEKQQEKIKEEIFRNKDKYDGSDLKRSMDIDNKMKEQNENNTW